MKLNSYLLLFLSVILFLVATCDSPVAEEGPPHPEFPLPINEKISLLRNCCNTSLPEYEDFHMAEWSPGEVYTTLQMRILTLESRTSVPFVISEEYFGGDVMYMTKSTSENILYAIQVTEYGESVGRLNIYNLAAEESKAVQNSNGFPIYVRHEDKAFTTIRDSTYNISSIRIRKLSDGSLLKVYYSYGNLDTGLEAGYYRLREAGPPDELLLAHSNPNGSRETINGFDLSPDGSTLLYPIHHAFVPGFAYGGPPPELATLNLETGAQEILPVDFNRQQFLWARYHPSGEKLVVSNYPRNIVGISKKSVDVDSMYIVDLNTFDRRPLNTRTWDQYYTADIFPDWSPDGNYLIYSSTHVNPNSTSIGRYSVYTMDMKEE
ncbi:MAG: hypothetical protein RIC57_11725 [Balneola sp.]